jgi:hypothetical protein
VTLLQQAVPGLTEEALLLQIAMQLGEATPPTPTRELETEFASWRLYELDSVGQRVQLALAEHNGQLLIVQLTSTPSRAAAYTEAVFVPVVEALDPAP